MNLRELNLKKTKEDLVNLFTKDTLIIQVVHTIEAIDSSMGKLVANLRERYSYNNINVSRIQDQNVLIRESEKLEKGELGVSLSKKDLESMNEIIKQIKDLNKFRNSQLNYLESLMKEVCLNLTQVSGVFIGAKLIDLASSLKNLAEIPSSKIQVLGAEKALFRHLIRKSRAPKFGVIFHHEAITKAENKGKAARQLASKISIAVKKDYFKNK